MRKASFILVCILIAAIISCSEENTVGPGGEDRDAEKARILKKYAPRLWFRTDEIYFPSSVEWTFPYLKRIKDDTGKYWLVTKSPLLGEYLFEGPEYKDVYEHAYFQGDLESAVIYAFWVEKEVGAEGEEETVIDLIYYIYYPFNRGKNCGGVRYENHVGDWEHLTVRLDKDDLDNPLQIALAAHSFSNVYDWADIDKVEENHPVAHVAWGSHGIWKNEGDHHYDTKMCDLHDYCNKGSSWDSWNHVVAFDFNRQKGLSGTPWPSWMGEDFTEPGASNPYDPAAGAIYRWGNPTNYCWELWACVLTTGPTGPVSKSVFYSEALE